MDVEAERPNRVEVAGHFFHDALDFEVRYNHCFYSDGPLFFTPRSRRAKCFIDLRMGIESILKSLLSYFQSDGRTGKSLVKWVEGHGHKIGDMLNKIEPNLPEGFLGRYAKQMKSLDSLPVGLRYRLDSWDFRGNREELYCDTVGCDTWLQQTHEALKELLDFTNEHLKQHTRILGSKEMWEELTATRYEKYT